MSTYPQQLEPWLHILDAIRPNAMDRGGLNDTLRALSRFYLAANQIQRSAIRSHMTGAVVDYLFPFAHQAAEESVQQGDQARILEGLAALSLGSDKIDPRDVIMAFSLLAHSAERISAEYQDLFQKALEFSSEDFGEQVRSFLLRDEEERSIYEMGYKEGAGSAGFKYVLHGEF